MNQIIISSIKFQSYIWWSRVIQGLAPTPTMFNTRVKIHSYHIEERETLTLIHSKHGKVNKENSPDV